MYLYHSISRSAISRPSRPVIFRRKVSRITSQRLVFVSLLSLFTFFLCRTIVESRTGANLGREDNSNPRSFNAPATQHFPTVNKSAAYKRSALLRTPHALEELVTGTFRAPDSRNVTEVNLFYLSACVTAITFVCLEIPFVPGCHNCERYVARITIDASGAPKENRDLDRVCDIIMGSRLCDFLDDIPICPPCEALLENSDAGTVSSNNQNKTALFK